MTSCISGSAAVLAVMSRRRAMISGGVFFGAPMPRQVPITRSMPRSFAVGTCSKPLTRLSAITISTLSLPPCTCVVTSAGLTATASM